jgi:hypothetical protein
MSTKPETSTAGSLIIPQADFYQWCDKLAKFPAGTFVAWGKIKVHDADATVEVKFTSSTAGQPAAPTEATPLPAPT